jgi:hypothetical protein
MMLGECFSPSMKTKHPISDLPGNNREMIRNAHLGLELRSLRSQQGEASRWKDYRTQTRVVGFQYVPDLVNPACVRNRFPLTHADFRHLVTV